MHMSFAPVFTEIFNWSLAEQKVPACFTVRHAGLVPVPQEPGPSCLSDCRPVALTSQVMKVFPEETEILWSV